MSKLSKVREVVETILIGIISIGACVTAAVVGGVWAILGAILVTVFGVARLAYTDNEFAYRFLRMAGAILGMVQVITSLTNVASSLDRFISFIRGLGMGQKFSDATNAAA